MFYCCCGFHNIGRTSQKLDVTIKQHITTKIENFFYLPTDVLNNTYGSSNADHLINNRKCADKFSVDLFFILSQTHSPFHLNVLKLSTLGLDSCK